MKENGLMVASPERECNVGSMANFMRATGWITKLMVEDVSLMLMVTFTQEILRKTSRMVSVFIATLTEPSTKGIGFKTSNMVTERKLGLTAPVIKANTKKEKDMAKAYLTILMAQHIMETSLITTFRILVFKLGAMVFNSQVFFIKIKCTELESLPGRMVNAMRGSMLMTRSKAMEFSTGQMVVNTKVSG